MIDRTPLHRPRVSRETRQLLVTTLLAVAALWALARIRYPDRPEPNPVPALLTQLAPRLSLTDVARESAEVRQRVGASLIALPWGTSSVAAYRIRADTALALLGRQTGLHTATRLRRRDGFDVAAVDRATGLGIARLNNSSPPGSTALWSPQQATDARYLLATVATANDVALQPVFVPAFDPVDDPGWSGPVWRVAPTTGIQAGSIVFTTDAELAGLVVTYEDGVAIVPAGTLLADANRLLAVSPRAAGRLGIAVQALTPPLAAATGSSVGVVVSWVDPAGPAAPLVAVGDVIEAVDGQWVDTLRHWDVRAARASAGDQIVLGVRRQGEWRDIQLVAAQTPAPAALGLELRALPRAGSEVMRVDRGSAADEAGLQRGDVITLIGTIAAPAPAQILRAHSTAGGKPLLIAFTRGSASRVTTFR